MNERTPLPFSWPDVKERLQRELPRLLAALGITAPIRGGMCQPLNPTRNDRTPGSFVIWCVHGRDGALGAWNEYATGEKGDVFELIIYLAGLRSKIDAYWWALDFLHLGRGVVRSKAQADADRERFARENAASKAKAEKVQRELSADLFRRWLKLAEWPGTLVETYLVRARGIDMALLKDVPGAMRFDPCCEHIDEETGVVTEWPAMVSAMTRGPDVVALHRTYLTPDGLAKAPVAKSKKMRGPVKGAAIRLTKGASGMTPDKAAQAGRLDPLLIGEGIETVLSVACARPDYRAWAAGSLGLMDGFEWPACASAVILLKDNDWSEPQAVARFQRVEAYWRAQAKGRTVKVAASPVGSDFNDFIKATAA